MEIQNRSVMYHRSDFAGVMVHYGMLTEIMMPTEIKRQMTKNIWNTVLFNNYSRFLQTTGAPFYQHGSIWILVWIFNYIHNKEWDEITHPFANFNNWTIKVWEWSSNFFPHSTGHVITYPGWECWTMLVKGTLVHKKKTPLTHYQPISFIHF